VRTHCTGAIDLPGTTWRDRPAISRSHTLTVATDQSAAPGLLAETGIAAAQLAVHHLAETGRPPQARTVTGLQASGGTGLIRATITGDHVYLSGDGGVRDPVQIDGRVPQP